MTVEKPKPKQLLRPIPTGAGSAMNQSSPITKRSNRNHVITFDSHLKIALFIQDNPLLQSTVINLVLQIGVD